MTDSYQAIYDAVRSRISGGNVGDIVREAAARAFDFSHYAALLHQDFSIVASEMQRPSVLYKPSISMAGTKWCALYGDDLMDGVAGWGDTPAQAMADFDQNWWKQKTPAALRLETTDGTCG